MYYPDLSPYEYTPHDREMLNVGWLSARYEFSVGTIDSDTLKMILDLAMHKRNLLRGVQDCEFCDQESPLRVPAAVERGYVSLGMGEIRVESTEGILYSAPSLIYHYIEAHNYLPPQAFLDAVRTGKIGPPESRKPS